MHTYFINRSKKRGHQFPWEGSWHWWIGDKHFKFEWCFGESFCHLKFGTVEDGYLFSIALPFLFAFWVVLGDERKCYLNRQTKFSFHDGMFSWEFHKDPFGYYESKSTWRYGMFDLVDFFFGKAKYSEKILEERDVIVPMPEGGYAAKAKLVTAFWERPRWFTKRLCRIHIDTDKGIPHAGKGENSWDCGDTATYGITCPANSIPEGVGKLVGSVLHTRIKTGGWRDYNWTRA